MQFFYSTLYDLLQETPTVVGPFYLAHMPGEIKISPGGKCDTVHPQTITHTAPIVRRMDAALATAKTSYGRKISAMNSLSRRIPALYIGHYRDQYC